MTRVFSGERTFLSPILHPVEAVLYRVAGVDEKHEQHWLTYAIAMLFFNLGGFIILYALLRFEAGLPLRRTFPEETPAGAYQALNERRKPSTVPLGDFAQVCLAFRCGRPEIDT